MKILTSKLDDETSEAISKAWREATPVTKTAFFSFVMAKLTFILNIAALASFNKSFVMFAFTLYNVFVWSAVFLSAYDWVRIIRKEKL